jgi:hypothetical protein
MTQNVEKKPTGSRNPFCLTPFLRIYVGRRIKIQGYKNLQKELMCP